MLGACIGQTLHMVVTCDAAFDELDDNDDDDDDEDEDEDEDDDDDGDAMRSEKNFWSASRSITSLMVSGALLLV